MEVSRQIDRFDGFRSVLDEIRRFSVRISIENFGVLFAERERKIGNREKRPFADFPFARTPQNSQLSDSSSRNFAPAKRSLILFTEKILFE